MKGIHLFVFLCFLKPCFSQDLLFVRSFYSDDFSHWVLKDSNHVELGSIQSFQSFKTVRDHWNIRFGESSGSVKLHWKENPNEWDYLFNQVSYYAAPVWPKQYDKWRITNNSANYSLSYTVDNEGINWSLYNSKEEVIAFIYNEYSRDLRDWIVEYDAQKIDPALLLFGVFLSCKYSTKEE